MPEEYNRREEDRNGTALSMRIDTMEQNVEERDKRNRKDIHDLKNSDQTIIDKLHRVELAIEPWTGSVGLLSKISRDVVAVGERVGALETAHEVAVGVSVANDKNNAARVEDINSKSAKRQWLIGTLIAVAAILAPLVVESCNHRLKVSYVSPGVTQNGTTTAGDDSIAKGQQ